jgi:hypothetical protein
MNYAQLRAAVQQYSQDFEASFTENIDTFIRLSEYRIALNVRLPQTRIDIEAQLTAHEPLWEVPSDFMAPDSLCIVTPTFMYFCLNKDPSFLSECYPDPCMMGMPRFYAYLNERSLKFGPTPDQCYCFRLAYFSPAPSIVDNYTTWMGEKFAHALLSGALCEAAKYQKAEDNLYARYNQAFMQDLAMDMAYAKGRRKKDTYEEPDKRTPA